ncbi:MAG: 50S ribosomal protein L15 [Porphyromonas sp.]|nr:50S ribosomal protein L15 [Porphyromonas sp.]
MDLSRLTPAKGSTKTRKRLGRGVGSGLGRTSSRGHKGAQSRSGYSRRVGFEGGQMPLQRRVPKFGFRSPNKVEYKPINLDVLQQLSEDKGLTEIGVEQIVMMGRADQSDLIKILGGGTLSAKLKVSAHAFSTSAKEAIEKAGGEVIVLKR